MTLIRLGVAAAIVGGAISLAAGLSPDAAAPAAAPSVEAMTFNVDPVHSSVFFKIRHVGVSNFMGRFNEIKGTYVLDPENLGSSSFDVTIAASSVDSNNERRNNHLKSPDFFNVAEHPELRFRSSQVQVQGDDHLKVTGEMLMHGVTKPLVVDMHVIGIGMTSQGFKSGIEATFTIKRTDFGMDKFIAEGGLGDDVEVTICLEGLRK